jgi:signal transduction histidine kinase
LLEATMPPDDSRFIDIFVRDTDVWAMERRLAGLAGGTRLHALTELAWHLRQRDSARALGLADEAQQWLEQEPGSATRHASVRARLLLVRGEVAAFHDQFDAARDQVQQALQLFERAQDWRGCGDAAMRVSALEWNADEREQSQVTLRLATEWAQRASDKMRYDYFISVLASRAVMFDPEAGKLSWEATMREQAMVTDDSCFTHAHEVLGRLAHYAGDHGESARHFLQSFQQAMSYGLLQQAHQAATNASVSFSNLNDSQASLDWAQRALDLARSTGWPAQLAMSLGQSSQCLALMKEWRAAYSMVCEAMAALNSNRKNSRDAFHFIHYKAQYALKLGNATECLELLEQLEAPSNRLRKPMEICDALVTRALAHAALGDQDGALSAAQGAKAVSDRGPANGVMRVDTLVLLADVHIQFDDLALPDGRQGASAALHFLTEAADLARTIRDYKMPVDLLQKTAQQYARLGEHKLAYETALAAGQAREHSQSQDARHLAVAMQIRHETERARAEGEHHRQLALAEGLRAEMFAQTIGTLQRLGAVGQEVTAHLDQDSVFAALDRHVHQMLDAASFVILLLDDDANSLTQVFGVEAGKPLPPMKLSMSNMMLDSVRCLRERREFSLEYEDGRGSANQVQGTLLTLSAMFAPLVAGDEALGVMTIQSPRAKAYGEREQLIFRSLCAFGAIALANARAYRLLDDTLGELRAAQVELMRRAEIQARMNAERDATLAFLAHDLRAPLVATVALLRHSPDLAELSKIDKFAHRALAMTDRFLDAARLNQPMHNQNNALDLASVVDDACDTFAGRAAAEQKKLDSSLLFGPTIRGNREELMRALCNLLDNALAVTPPGGCVEVGMQMHGGRVELRIADAGPGLPDAAVALLTKADALPATPDRGRLGLKIVADVLRRHDVQVSVETGPKGTRLRLAFECTGSLDSAHGYTAAANDAR